MTRSQRDAASLLPKLLAESPLYAIVDTGLCSVRSSEFVAAELLRAGVRVLQYRHKQPWRREHFEECARIARMAHQEEALFIVNDRADAAALSGADGVHLGQTDMLPSDARSFLGPDAIIGYSTHNAAQAEESASWQLDYLAIGPVHATTSKADPDPVIGLRVVSEVRRLTQRPLVAIGGITAENATAVLEAGADAVAVIRDLVCATDIQARARQYLALAKRHN